MITREKEPPNLEMPFGALESFVTPAERFYVRCHFPVPKINEREWRLKVQGKVARPCEMTMDELREIPVRTVMATIECAGNSRVFLIPKVKGVQWELGAVGNAEWTGVSVRDENGPVLVPLAEMQVKAEIARPVNNEIISANSTYDVKGAAWTAEGVVTKVEVSCDGGKSWSEATLNGDATENAWRLWEFEWVTPAPGNYTLTARATDSRGRIQPMEPDADANNYMICHCLPIEVEVRR